MLLYVVVIGSVGFGLRVCSLVDCLCAGCLIGFLLMMLRFVIFVFMDGWLFVAWLARFVF